MDKTKKYNWKPEDDRACCEVYLEFLILGNYEVGTQKEAKQKVREKCAHLKISSIDRKFGNISHFSIEKFGTWVIKKPNPGVEHRSDKNKMQWLKVIKDNPEKVKKIKEKVLKWKKER